MKFFLLIFLLILNNCSFDNKTGIWKNVNETSNKQTKVDQNFKILSSSKDPYSEIIPKKNDFIFKSGNTLISQQWNDIYYNKGNNSENFKYKSQNLIIFKSKKLSRNSTNQPVLFNKNNFIFTNEKGSLIVFSINGNKVISKFNFYKKKFRKIKKSLNIIAENDVIYVADNIGYLYAYNYVREKIVWAKNYKIPFRSNLKLFENKLIASDQNNNLYFLDKKNGNIIKLFPTEETIVKNQFVNNLSISDEILLFLNTYGSIYSIDLNSMKMKWFLNLNKSFDVNPSNLFLSTEVINNGELAIISSNNETFAVNADNGAIVFKKNFSPDIKPIIHKNYLFLITNKSFLVAIDLNNGKIIYSYDLNQKVADFLDTKKKKIFLESMILVNNQLYIFLKNSYIIKIDMNGNINSIQKLKEKINSIPIFIDSSLLYLNSKNKLIIVD
tara:strand:+ start:1053 stop:2375 length:1323 start_codon:yes stop_codon:yes gene_type:complete